MIYRINKPENRKIGKSENRIHPTSDQSDTPIRRQAGVTLLLAILVLASLLAISFSLATILFIEVRSSADLLRSEGSLYGATGVGEEALFNLKRQVCVNNDPACLSSKYTSNFFNNVSLTGTPALTTTSTPIFQDKVPANTTFTNTGNKYDFCDVTAGSSGCGYGKVTVNYISTGSDQNSLFAYLCQFDPGAPQGTYQTLPTCTALGQSQGYWKQPDAGNWQSDGSTQLTPSTNPSASWTIDSTKQQQLVLTAPTANANVFFSVQTFASDGVTPKGLPYVGKTSVVINTSNGSVGRKIQVVVPNGSGSTGGGSGPAFVQGKAQTGGCCGGSTLTLGTNVKVGNTLIFGIDALAGTLTSVTDNLGNTWTQDGTHANTTQGGNGFYWYHAPITTGGTITVSANGTSRPDLVLVEVSGIGLKDVTDYKVNFGMNAVTTSSGTITASQANDFMVTMDSSNGGSYSANTPTTNLTDGSNMMSLYGILANGVNTLIYNVLTGAGVSQEIYMVAYKASP